MDGKLLATRKAVRVSHVRPVLVLLLVAGLILSVLILKDALKPSFAADYPDYATVDALRAVSDAIVVGQVGESIGKFEDRGGDPEFDEFGDPIPGIPMEVFAFNVSRASTSEIAVGDTIPVLWVDLDAVNSDDLTRLHPGDELVLFLEHLTPASAPDLAKFGDEVWVPVSGDNGVMDVGSDGSASPRSSVVEKAVIDLRDIFG